MNYRPLSLHHFPEPLASAFYSEAQARGAQVYTDSFGQPYFFRRSKSESPLFPETEVAHVEQIKLIIPTPCAIDSKEVISPSDEKSTFGELMKYGVQDKIHLAVFREIMGKKDYAVAWRYQRSHNEGLINVYHKSQWVMQIVVYDK